MIVKSFLNNYKLGFYLFNWSVKIKYQHLEKFHLGDNNKKKKLKNLSRRADGSLRLQKIPSMRCFFHDIKFRIFQYSYNIKGIKKMCKSNSTCNSEEKTTCAECGILICGSCKTVI
jgi:hypothetical protein